MSPQDEPRSDEQKEQVGAQDPRRGAIPTVAPEDERDVDTRELESDKKESDEMDNKRREDR